MLTEMFYVIEIVGQKSELLDHVTAIETLSLTCHTQTIAQSTNNSFRKTMSGFKAIYIVFCKGILYTQCNEKD